MSFPKLPNSHIVEEIISVDIFKVGILPLAFGTLIRNCLRQQVNALTLPELNRSCFECNSFQRGASYRTICS